MNPQDYNVHKAEDCPRCSEEGLRDDCSECGGYGYIVISGRIRNKIPCGNCHGSGHDANAVECPACNGWGYVEGIRK